MIRFLKITNLKNTISIYKKIFVGSCIECNNFLELIQSKQDK